MNPFFQAKVPSPKEMWKDEPNKFRQWIILFGAASIIFAILLITSIILMSFQYYDIKDAWISAIKASSTKATDAEIASSAKTFVLFRLIGSSIFTATLLLISITLYSVTIFKSYKNKSFSKVSAFSIYFSEFIGFFALLFVTFSLSSIAGMDNIIKNNSGILIWIIAQVFSVTLFVFAWQVSKIRKRFAYSERMQQLQQDPQFQQMQQQMNNMFNQTGGSNAYGPASTTQASPKATQAEVKESPVVEEESAEIKELKKLKVKELQEIASQLSISGYEKMKKQELIETIIRVTKEK